MTQSAAEERFRLDRGDGVHLAARRLGGRGPVLIFLPGFASDMAGTKAAMLAEFAASRGQALLRLDYSGHGESEGAFTEGTIGRWAADAGFLIDRLVTGPRVLIGSSMGGWIALLLARAMAARGAGGDLAGLVGIAAAPDFTERLIRPALSAAQRAALARDGRIDLPNPYGPPTPITAALLADGAVQSVLDQPIPLACPVRLMHGQRDAEVPWQTALDIAAAVTAADTRTILIKDGDHRLSREEDLRLLRRVLRGVIGKDGF
ncbi:MAG: alpha/beta hydrolase [Rhodospirillales bacterium]|nr:alpha/beta hydrolase [Rhodospirillales bacterium]